MKIKNIKYILSFAVWMGFFVGAVSLWDCTPDMSAWSRSPYPWNWQQAGQCWSVALNGDQRYNNQQALDGADLFLKMINISWSNCNASNVATIQTKMQQIWWSCSTCIDWRAWNRMRSAIRSCVSMMCTWDDLQAPILNDWNLSCSSDANLVSHAAFGMNYQCCQTNESSNSTGTEVWSTGTEIWSTGTEVWSTGTEVWSTGSGEWWLGSGNQSSWSSQSWWEVNWWNAVSLCPWNDQYLPEWGASSSDCRRCGTWTIPNAEHTKCICDSTTACCGIQLNMGVPFIGDCIEMNTDSSNPNTTSVTSVTAFPILMQWLMKILMSVIMIFSFLMIIVSWLMITAWAFNWSSYNKWITIIKNVIISLILLWSSWLILSLINPSFFGG